MEEPTSKGGLQWLKVRVRRTESEHGGAKSYHVYCPTQSKHVPVGDCTHCEHHIAIDRRDRGVFLVCDAQAKELELRQDDGEARTLTPAERTPVSEVMTQDVSCVTRELAVGELMTLLLERNISGVPVVDERGTAVGVVTKTDVIRAVHAQRDPSEREPWELSTPDGLVVAFGPGFEEEAFRALTVDDIMSPVVFVMPEDVTVARAAALMAFDGVHRIPIVGSDNQVVGLLSSLDVLRWLAKDSGYVVPKMRAPSRHAGET